MRVRGYAGATPCWMTLSTTDPARSAAFYDGLFGWTHADGVFRLGNWATAGLLPGASAGWATYVSTEDITGTVAAVRTAGGVVLAEPVEVAPGGLMAMCADPAGAVFGCWQRTTFAGTQVVNEPGAILWHEVAVRDRQAAETFYGKVFGWSARAAVAARGVDYVEWTVEGRVVAGLTSMGEAFPPDVPPHWRVFFAVDEMARTVERCRGEGGQVLAGPLDAGVGRYAHLQDPCGATLGVVELAPELRDRL